MTTSSLCPLRFPTLLILPLISPAAPWNAKEMDTKIIRSLGKRENNEIFMYKKHDKKRAKEDRPWRER